MKTPFNKFLYVGFLALGLYQALVNKDYLQAASQLGIALAFDPFNPEESWTVRPTWQKAVLIVHLAIVAAMFGFAIGLNRGHFVLTSKTKRRLPMHPHRLGKSRPHARIHAQRRSPQSHESLPSNRHRQNLRLRQTSLKKARYMRNLHPC
ncbi:MAG: hypothetical protein RI977_1321 [Bacteroidota bacterium]